MERVGRQLGRVALRGPQAAQRSGHLVRRDAGCVEEERALGQLDDRTAGGARAAHPRASKPASTTRPSSTLTATRIRSPQAAPGSPGMRRAGERTEPARIEMRLEHQHKTATAPIKLPPRTKPGKEEVRDARSSRRAGR